MQAGIGDNGAVPLSFVADERRPLGECAFDPAWLKVLGDLLWIVA